MTTALPRIRILVKGIQIILVIPLIVCMTTFHVYVSVRVTCVDQNAAVLSEEVTALSDQKVALVNGSSSTWKQYVNYTIAYPFVQKLEFDVDSCNVTGPVVEHTMHTNEQLSAHFVMAVTVLSSIYAFIYSSVYLNVRNLSQRDVTSELASSLILFCLWISASVMWLLSVINLCHFVKNAVSNLPSCADRQSRCDFLVTGDSILKLYISVLFTFLNSGSWIACTIWRLHTGSSEVVYPLVSAGVAFHSAKFTAANDESVASPQAFVATIEDKIEYQRPGTEQYVRFFD